MRQFQIICGNLGPSEVNLRVFQPHVTSNAHKDKQAPGLAVAPRRDKRHFVAAQELLLVKRLGGRDEAANRD